MSIIAEFQYLLAGLLFLAVDGHHMLIQAVSESYTATAGSRVSRDGHPGAEPRRSVARAVRHLVKISAPVVVALVFANIGLGLIARTVPQINILVVGFPLQIAIGLIGIGLTVPVFLDLAGGLSRTCPGRSAC